MAQKIKVITADSKSGLEEAINKYVSKANEDDPRVVIELAGGVTCSADGLWIAAVVLNAAHKRSFEEEE